VAEEQGKAIAAVKQHVQIEIFAWLTRFVGGDGGGRRFFTEEFTAGDTLEEVVRGLTRRFPELDHVLWDGDDGQLGASVEIIVNDAFLGLSHSLNTGVNDGDRITLLPAWDGG